MHRIMVTVIVLGGLLCGGCSVKMTAYSPSILMEGNGKVKVGNFMYDPIGNNIIKSNQIDTGSGFNPIYAEMDIKDYVSDAVAKELKYIGYKLDQKSIKVVSGNIQKWECDYFGLFYVDVLARIEFIVTSESNGENKELYRKVHEGKFRANKLTVTEITAVVNEGLRNCIKSFIIDAQREDAL